MIILLLCCLGCFLVAFMFKYYVDIKFRFEQNGKAAVINGNNNSNGTVIGTDQLGVVNSLSSLNATNCNSRFDTTATAIINMHTADVNNDNNNHDNNNNKNNNNINGSNINDAVNNMNLNE